MTLSSLSFATEHARTAISVKSLSDSPFQVDREKARMQSQKIISSLPARGGEVELNTLSSTSTSVSPTKKEDIRAYNPWLTMSLQENHLLSIDIGSWAKSQGMRILWNSNRDYLIYSTINLTGKNRDEILNQLGQLFRSENYGLVVKLYEKNNVLVIDGQ